jgi:7-cyano-7-deazaguanine synthase
VSGSLVVLSGGLDSTVCMAIAQRELGGGAAGGGGNGGSGGGGGGGCGGDPGPAPVAVTFDYGQRHRVELGRAAGVAGFYRAEHVVVPIDLSGWGGSALTDATIAVPEAGQSAAGDIPATYVPARNLIFLAVAVGIAEARDLDAVYLGVNALDYSGYPDCRPEFIASFAGTAALALKRGIEGRPVEIRTPLIDLGKADIVRLGVALAAPLQLTWSCYRGGDHPCHTCDSCALRAKGFAEAGVPDPAP